MPAWIHDRARHLQDKNPEMPEGQAFAIATQQAYAVGKAPKKFGTKEGKKAALKKYDSPKSEYKKTAGSKMASNFSLVSILGFADELQKISMSTSPTTPGDVRKAVGYAGTALSKKKPSYTKVHKEPTPTASASDLTESSKTVQPPPITTPGAV